MLLGLQSPEGLADLKDMLPGSLMELLAGCLSSLPHWSLHKDCLRHGILVPLVQMI